MLISVAVIWGKDFVLGFSITFNSSIMESLINSLTASIISGVGLSQTHASSAHGSSQTHVSSQTQGSSLVTGCASISFTGC